MSDGESTLGRLRAFAHVNAEKVHQYRAIMRAFMEAKARFAIHLRPPEILVALSEKDLPEPMDAAAVDAALGSLCEWGNLEAHQDTADVSTVEEFYRPRYLYQLTPEGEAAERAIAVYWESVRQPGELQAAALGDIRDRLHEIHELALLDSPDEAKVHLTLRSLRERFDELTSQAQTFIGGLQRTIDLQGIDVETFLSYKETLIQYLERFIGELLVATVEIADVLQRIEFAGVEGLLQIAARRDLVDALAPTEEEHEATIRIWRTRWQGLRGWFVGRPDTPSQAEVLRARARSAIPALLSAVASIHDRRVTRSDRATDLRTLARWFAEADTDRDAHRLWRAAFALTPARHLRIDADTLDNRDANPVSPKISWLRAPPLLICPRLRRTGHYTRRGRPSNVVDFSADKARLAELAEAEAEQITAAQQRLATGKRMRLSQIGHLDPVEFNLFLDLLGEALTKKVRPDHVVEASSADGALNIQLAPTEDGDVATIRTPKGLFSGVDHFVLISKSFQHDDVDGTSINGVAAAIDSQEECLQTAGPPRKPR